MTTSINRYIRLSRGPIIMIGAASGGKGQSNMSTNSYGAKLFGVFQRASQETFEIVLPDARSAFALRSRLNKLRVAMRKEGHHMLAVAESVSLSINKTRPHIIIAGPSDERYLAALDKVVPDVTPELIAAAEAMPQYKPPISQEDILNEYFSTKEK